MSNQVNDTLSILCKEITKNNCIKPEYYEKYGVKRGLRNDDGTGVLVGLTQICSVRGYVINDSEPEAIDGKLIYRGYNINDIVENCEAENRFCFEEVCWLLIFGSLPTKSQLKDFQFVLGQLRELPPYFVEDMILKAPAKNIMNKLARAVLTLYSFDEADPEDNSVENVVRQSLELIARMPVIMNFSYQAKRRHFDKKSMYFHPIDPSQHTAELILSTIRSNRKFTEREAKLLDICLALHAEHGGGNNSTFATRVLSSAGTDTYSAIGAAIGSLKGSRHGGANIKVMDQLETIKANVSDWGNEDEVALFLDKIVKKEAGDGSGLIYGMGHAVYTKSDPRAIILKKYAREVAETNGYGDEFKLLESIEKLAPQVLSANKSSSKSICANVDLYSGLVYKSLAIPEDLFTPLFAVARVAGWCAHRIEEILTSKRIIRPAYKSVFNSILEYTPIDKR